MDKPKPDEEVPMEIKPPKEYMRKLDPATVKHLPRKYTDAFAPVPLREPTSPPPIDLVSPQLPLKPKKKHKSEPPPPPEPTTSLKPALRDMSQGLDHGVSDPPLY